jgi:transposase-like protein
MDDFFGKDGIFARLFGKTLEHLLEAELTAQLGYEKYEAKGRNSGNNRNGKYKRKVRSSAGETEIAVPRDRNGEFVPTVLRRYETSSNELEDKIVTLYAKGMTNSDIRASLAQMYGMDVSEATISAVTDKVLPLVEAGPSRPLADTYALVYLDAIMVKLRRDSRVEKTAVYIVLGVDLEGRKDALGHSRWRWRGRCQILDERAARFADTRCQRHSHCLSGWLNRIQRSSAGGLSQNAHPAL